MVLQLPTHGRYFVLKSYLNNFAMTVDSNSPKKRVILWPTIPDAPVNQLWYDDHDTKTIRSKLNGFCLQLDGKTLQIAPFNGQAFQQWIIYDRHIVKLDNPNEALDVLANNKDPGAEIGKWSKHWENNQLWAVEYVKPQYFTVKNVTNSSMLTAEGTQPGAQVLARKASTPGDNQLWYEDKFGIIRSKVNDYALDSSSGSVCLKPYDPNKFHQQFIPSNDCLVNRHDRHLVLHLNMREAGGVVCGKAGNADSERWRIEYI